MVRDQDQGRFFLGVVYRQNRGGRRWESLRTAIRFVVETADEIERKLTNKDDF
jgi:hypothetical protein